MSGVMFQRVGETGGVGAQPAAPLRSATRLSPSSACRTGPRSRLRAGLAAGLRGGLGGGLRAFLGAGVGIDRAGPRAGELLLGVARPLVGAGGERGLDLRAAQIAELVLGLPRVLQGLVGAEDLLVDQTLRLDDVAERILDVFPALAGSPWAGALVPRPPRVGAVRHVEVSVRVARIPLQHARREVRLD